MVAAMADRRLGAAGMRGRPVVGVTVDRLEVEATEDRRRNPRAGAATVARREGRTAHLPDMDFRRLASPIQAS